MIQTLIRIKKVKKTEIYSKITLVKVPDLLVLETCWFLHLRPSLYPYASNHGPYSVGIVFYMMWHMINRAQLVVCCIFSNCL